MLKNKNKLVGKVKSKVSLKGKLNNAVIRIQPVTQEKTIIPTASVQEIIPDENYTALSKVTVESIPSEYIIPTGTLEITENGEYDVKGYTKVNVDIPVPPKFAPRVISFSDYTGSDLDYEVQNIDTSNIISFRKLFYYCVNITSLELNHWNTSKVTTMSNTFDYCNTLNTLNLSDWITSNLTNLDSTFKNCSKLTILDLSNWETINVTNMNMLFYGCKSLTLLDIRKFDFTNVSNYSYAFYNVPVNCEIIVKDDTAKQWVLTQRSDFTNVKTVAELGG